MLIFKDSATKVKALVKHVIGKILNMVDGSSGDGGVDECGVTAGNKKR